MDYETLNQGNEETDEGMEDEGLEGEEDKEEDEEEDFGLESEDE